jgi:hypothetical protein
LYEKRPVNQEIERRNAEAFEAALHLTLKRLITAGKHVVFILDNPELDQDPRRCLKRPVFSGLSTQNCSVSRRDYEERNRRYRSIVDRAKAKFSEVDFFDSSEVFCGKYICSAVSTSNGELLYATEDHLTPAGSRLLMSRVAPRIFRPLDEK